MDAPSSSSFAAVKPKFINGKIVWSGGPSIKQYFALPESVMYYIARNPSTPEVYKKLIRSCKYFFEKNPLLIARDLYRNTKICSNKDCDVEPVEYADTKKCCIDIDLSKLSSRIWITNNVCLDEENISTFASLIYPKLFRWQNIQLDSYAEILFNDYKNCAAFLSSIRFLGCRIINDDGSVVMLDKILEMIPDVKTCLFCFEGDISMINASTMKNICKLKNLQNLESFALANLPEIFNVEDLSKFIKDRVNTKIQFSFNENISDEYKIQLDKLIDIVIKTELINCRICYPGQNEVKNQILNDRYYRY